MQPTLNTSLPPDLTASPAPSSRVDLVRVMGIMHLVAGTLWLVYVLFALGRELVEFYTTPPVDNHPHNVWWNTALALVLFLPPAGLLIGVGAGLYHRFFGRRFLVAEVLLVVAAVAAEAWMRSR